jgi:hypothetical protein
MLVGTRCPLCSVDAVALTLWAAVMFDIETGTAVLAFVLSINSPGVEDSRQQPEHIYHVLV